MADNDNNLVFTVSSDMTAAQRGLTKFVGDIGTATNQIAKKYEQAGTKIDSSISGLQSRINGMVGLGAKASKEWTGALADQGKELERLRARYSPLFATINQYKTAVADIKRAHALGAISANEMATAISKERQAALASTAAIKGRNAALAATPVQRHGTGGSGFQTANIAAQFQDIAVTSAMGMNPLQIALQQGTQLSSVFATMGSGRQVIAGLGAAFASLVSPVSLVTIGLIAGGAAAIQYFSSVSMGGAKSEEALKKEAELIQQVADKWGGVLPELKKYADERQKLVDQKEQKDAVAAAASQQWDDLRKNIGLTQAMYANFLQTFNDQAADTAKVGALQKAYKELTDGIANGTATSEQAKAVQEALLALMQETGIKAVGDFAKTFDALADSIGKASDRAAKLKSDAAFITEFAKSTLPVLGTVGPVYSDNGNMLTNPLEIDRYNKQQQDNRNPTIDTGRGLPVAVPTPTAKPIQLGEEPDKAIEKQETAATKAANAYRDLKKSADDRIEQMRQEIELTGKYGTEADAARFALDLLQQSEDKGRSLSEAQRKELAEKVELYRQYADALAKTKLSQDLLDNMRLSSMSERDRQITTTLRQYGLPEDLGGQDAKAIGKQYDWQQAKDTAKSFGSAFSSELVSGSHDIGKSFIAGLKASLEKETQKLWDRVFDSLGTAFANLVTGTKGGSSAGGAATGIGGAIASVFSDGVSGKAPVGAVTRSALPNVGATKTGIGLAQISTSGGLVASVNKQFASNFQGLINDLESTGYKIKSLGGYNYRNIAGTSKLSNHAFGDAIDINPATNPMGKSLITDLPPNAAALAAQNGLSWGGGWNSKKDAMHFEVGSADSASKALEKLAGSSTEATKGLGSLSQLTSAFPAAPSAPSGGGGLMGLLGGLFGAFKPIGAQAGLAAAGGIGLYADGGHVSGAGGPTDDSIPAMLSNGEFVINSRATKKHRQLLEAINTGRVARFASGGLVSPRLVSGPSMPSLSPRGQATGKDSSGGTLNVHVYGANGDDHVKTLVKQGVGQALGDYNKQQQRGGFGEDQRRFSNRKG